MRLKMSSTKYYIYTSLDGIPDVTKDILTSNTLDFTYNFPGRIHFDVHPPYNAIGSL